MLIMLVQTMLLSSQDVIMAINTLLLHWVVVVV